MSQTINAPLSGRGIGRLIRETENWKNRLQERIAVFLDRVAQEGMERASVKFSQAVYDGTNDVSVTVEPRGNNVRAVVATGGATLFIEFGTGVTYPDDHPEAGELGMKRGEYGQGHGKQHSWGYYGDPGTNGVLKEKKNGGFVVITHGDCEGGVFMIDVESQIYTPIAEALRAQFPGILVSGEYVNAPTRFPYVSLVEQDNYTTEAHMDSGDTERFATLMYEVNVYSDKAGGKKSVCRKIMRFVDDLMYAKNFRRISLSPVPNLENATIYRLVARYKAETDGTTLYRR